MHVRASGIERVTGVCCRDKFIIGISLKSMEFQTVQIQPLHLSQLLQSHSIL